MTTDCFLADLTAKSGTLKNLIKSGQSNKSVLTQERVPIHCSKLNGALEMLLGYHQVSHLVAFNHYLNLIGADGISGLKNSNKQVPGEDLQISLGFLGVDWSVPPGYIEFVAIFNGQDIPYKLADYNPQTKTFYWPAGGVVIDRSLFNLSPYANAVPPEVHSPLVALQLQRLDGTLDVDCILRLANQALSGNAQPPALPPPPYDDPSGPRRPFSGTRRDDHHHHPYSHGPRPSHTQPNMTSTLPTEDRALILSLTGATASHHSGPAGSSGSSSTTSAIEVPVTSTHDNAPITPSTGSSSDVNRVPSPSPSIISISSSITPEQALAQSINAANITQTVESSNPPVPTINPSLLSQPHTTPTPSSSSGRLPINIQFTRSGAAKARDSKGKGKAANEDAKMEDADPSLANEELVEYD
ncbi:hypothetical protein NP233_g10091 [Leucocoprinus birnbaumii]|uniref:Uncharacterized protein n=1 Tax=Leucocoprinus birnbaumii TaxID=56174 RepID=A0AAD5YQ76_9AGAR|nr:hypothetical protein NP233_g10091 [Leucocoprinus birnbaumii]